MPILDRRQPYTPSGSEEDEEVKDTSSRDEEEESPEEPSTSNDEQESEEEPSEEATEGDEPDEAAEDEEPETTESSVTEPEETELDKDRKANEAIKAEKARLLKEVEDLRLQRRKLRQDGPEVPPPLIVDSADPNELADIDPTSVEVIERVIKAKGYVKKEEIHAEAQQKSLDEAQNSWLKDHPEYLPANDPDDTRWNALISATKIFVRPTTAQELQRVLSLAHRDLNPDAPTKSPTIPQKSRAAIDAKAEKIKVSSKTGGGAGTRATSSASKKNLDLSGLQGFTKEELEELAS